MQQITATKHYCYNKYAITVATVEGREKICNEVHIYIYIHTQYMCIYKNIYLHIHDKSRKMLKLIYKAITK